VARGGGGDFEDGFTADFADLLILSTRTRAALISSFLQSWAWRLETAATIFVSGSFSNALKRGKPLNSFEFNGFHWLRE
jgi:hypothetical protein